MAQTRCKAKTKAGKRCKSFVVMETEFCMAHQPAEVRASKGFVPEAGALGGRPRRPRATEVLKERVEADVERVLKPLFESLEAEKAVAVSGGAREPGFIEYVPDMPTRLRAAADVLDRVYGKPKQTTELSGPGGDPIKVEVPRSSQRAADVARILAGAGALPSSPPQHEGRSRRAAPAPARPPVNGNGNGAH